MSVPFVNVDFAGRDRRFSLRCASRLELITRDTGRLLHLLSPNLIRLIGIRVTNCRTNAACPPCARRLWSHDGMAQKCRLNWVRFSRLLHHCWNAGVCHIKAVAMSRCLEALTLYRCWPSLNLVSFILFPGVQLFEETVVSAVLKFSLTFGTVLRSPSTVGVTFVSTFHSLFISLSKSLYTCPLLLLFLAHSIACRDLLLSLSLSLLLLSNIPSWIERSRFLSDWRETQDRVVEGCMGPAGPVSRGDANIRVLS